MSNSVKKLLTVPEVAKLLRVSRTTIWRWCKAGKFHSAFKMGRSWRIRRSEIEQIIGESLNDYEGVCYEN